MIASKKPEKISDISTLRKQVIKENTIGHEYEEKLRRMSSSTNSLDSK